MQAAGEADEGETAHMKPLVEYFAVGAAGFFGAVLRLFIGQVCGRLFGTTFPVGTLFINVVGSFLLGWFLTFAGDRLVVSETMRLAVAVGFLGAFTTYSTFMYESNTLWEHGALLKAIANVVGSLVFGLAALRLGMYLAS